MIYSLAGARLAVLQYVSAAYHYPYSSVRHSLKVVLTTVGCSVTRYAISTQYVDNIDIVFNNFQLVSVNIMYITANSGIISHRSFSAAIPDCHQHGLRPLSCFIYS